MRLIDIYKETASGTVLVTAGCIQAGVSDLKRTPLTKLYTMADGTVTAYPVPTAKAEMTLTLECTEVQAAAVDRAAHEGALLFAGLRFGAKLNAQPLPGMPYSTGFRGFLSGAVDIAEKYAGTGIYVVSIPLLLDASGEVIRSANVPAIMPSALSLGGAAENLGLYELTRMTVGSEKVTAFVRMAALYVRSETLALSLSLSISAAGTDISGASFTCSHCSDAAISGGIATATLNLNAGLNSVVLAVSCTGCRALRYCIPIYRQF